MNEASFGETLKFWRKRKGWSQMELGAEIEMSTRHISFIENGRSNPSQKAVQRIADALHLSLRDRNTLLSKAGYAAEYSEMALSDPALQQINGMLATMIEHMEPFPAILMGNYWQVHQVNRSFEALCRNFCKTPDFYKKALNIIDVLFNPEGFRNSIVNWDNVAHFLHHRISRADESARQQLPKHTQQLISEVLSSHQKPSSENNPLIMPLQLKSGDLEVSLFTATSRLGDPHDITLQEVVIEYGLPYDQRSKTLIQDIYQDYLENH
jgi:transcriptional regulator with XRE-family HTH domain